MVVGFVQLNSQIHDMMFKQSRFFKFDVDVWCSILVSWQLEVVGWEVCALKPIKNNIYLK
jgi:hypothetical protein